jgi:hypothetical protein
MRDITQINGDGTITFTASNTKGRAWMQNYYGSHTIIFKFEAKESIIAFKKALLADGLTLLETS